ncbi:DUF2000 domain-containing protein [Agrobacterium sp.]|uniref:DUF2000 domain-containing protein n=1 Tax=Agrobacterium sp. TaxID=361 RepID=UPI0028AC61DC|nr:DUF2000 domain-containing protein [Agrobacterium sp.]
MTPDLHTAIIVNPALPMGLIANTIGAIGIGIGAKIPQLAADRLTDMHERSIDISSNRPVPILQADADTIRNIMLKIIDAGTQDIVTVPFPAFARALHNYQDYQQTFPDRDLSQEVIDGLGLAGPTKLVRSLTGALKLLR